MYGTGTALAQVSGPPLGAAAGYGLLSGGGIQAANGLRVFGKAGASQTVSSTVTATNGVLNNGADPLPQALSSAQQARTWCATQTGQTPLPTLAGQSLPAGTYATAGGITLAPGQVLTLTGDTSSRYVFNIGGSLTLQAGSRLNLGQVLPHHVYWHVQGNLTAAAYASWGGVVLTDGAASFAGDFYGRLAVLAGGGITLASRDVASGTLAFVAPGQLPPGPVAPPDCGPAAVACVPGGPVNLVRNPSFEAGICTGNLPDFDGYPTGQPSRVGCWLGVASPDWFTNQAGCQNYGGGTPTNIFNLANPANGTTDTPIRTGGAYAGIYAKGPAPAGTPNGRGEQREYLVQVLPQALQAGQAYYVEYYASLAPASWFTLARLQVAFGPALPAKPASQLPAGILSPADATVVASTGNLPTGLGPGWTRVSGAFKPLAGSNFRVMLLGNFEPGDVGGTGPGNPVQPPRSSVYPADYTALDGAYYYIEDVSLVAFPSAGPTAVQVACGTGTARLGTCPLPEGAGATYQWLPATGLSNPNIANPTVTLAPGALPITYTLTVRAGGQTFESSTTVSSPAPQTCPCALQAFRQNAGATYQAPAGQQPYELGESNFNAAHIQNPTHVVVNGNGRTVVFDGIYHILSPIRFVNGIFEVRPGTVFYAEGGTRWGYPSLFSGCYQGQGLDNFLQVIVGKDALLRVRGGTFTSTCAGQWGGLELRDNGALETEADPATGRRCVVSQARVGVQLGNVCLATDANCSLTGTDFLNNRYGVTSLGFSQAPDLTRNRITDCTFASSLSAMLPPYFNNAAEYTQVGLVLHGPWHDNIDYRKNRFESVYVGVEVAGGTDRMALTDNAFTNNYGAAIQVAAGGNYLPYPNVPAPVGTVLLADNHITVPDNPSPGGQVPAGAAVRGIQVLALPQGGKTLLIEANTIQSASGGSVAGKPMLGLDAQLSFDQHLVQRQNQFIGLDEGIRLMDASGATTQQEYVTDNYFAKNRRAVVLAGQQYAPFAPAISCNTIESGDVGIYVESNSTVGQLSGPQGGPGPYGFEPVANRYSNLSEDVHNDGIYAINYYALDNPVENVNSGAGNPVNTISTAGTPCDQRPTYGPGTYGLFRPAAEVGSTLEQVQEWEDNLTNDGGTPVQQHRWTLQLIDYRETNQQLGQLETFANTLPLLNDAAFDRLSLYLMEKYRRGGQSAAVQRVRQNLLAHRGQSAEVQLRVSYFDVADRVALLAPGAAPAPADSAALVTVAGSPSGFAPVACSLLRYFYPASTCQASGGSGKTQPHLASARPVRSLSGRVQFAASPNPAHDQVTLRFASALPPDARLELVEVATGRVVLARKTDGVLPLTLNVATLPAGVFAGRLLDGDGRLLGTGKIVVLH